MEPDLSHDIRTCLLSSETGIVDSHGLMAALEDSIHEAEGGEIVLGTRVVRIDPAASGSGWIIQTQTVNRQGDSDEISSVLARCVINCAGLKSVNESLSACFDTCSCHSIATYLEQWP